MPPLRRSPAAALPTILSLSKLLHLIPASLSSVSKNTAARHAKRSVIWAAATSTSALLDPAVAAPIEPEDPPESPEFMFKLILSVGLVLLGGVFAGLTLALMGSDDLNLRVLAASSSDPRERQAATKVLRLLHRGRHWVLVVLLLGNVIVNESLPIFLDDVLGGGLAAVVVSTAMIVIFGEIIPQAVCVRYGLAIGGVCAPFVHALMLLMAPIAWPIAKLLDWVLGHDEGHTYKKAELKSFLQFHREGEEPLRDDEIVILNGVLSLNDRHAQEIMTPIKDCLTLSADEVLDHAMIDQILISGFSRIPVHEPGQSDNFIGMLLVKRLITYNPEDQWPVSKFPLLPLPEAKPEINCFQALDYFQTGRAHLILISETPGQRGGALGIVSLEDLIEEIIGEEIIDETDRYQDNHSKRKAQRKATGAIMRGIIERQRVINAFAHPSRSETHSPASGAGGNNGLLVQINDGELVAEHVAVTEGLSESPQQITLISNPSHQPPQSLQAPLDPQPKKTFASIVKEAVGVESNGDSNINNGSHGETNGEVDADVHTSNGSDLETGQGNEPKYVGSEPFPTPGSFRSACQAFTAKYSGRTSASASAGTHLEPGPERTNVGWQWIDVDSKWREEQGYLCRRATRWVTNDEESDAAARGDGEKGDDEVSDAGAELELELEEDDECAVHVTTPMSSRIETELSVVYSATYRVPMLCLRAWDEVGVPLSLSDLVLHVLRFTAVAHMGAGAGARADALLIPDSPFPLLQQTEHPCTGEVVWSIHPCQVRAAVDEIVNADRKDSRDGRKEQKSEHGVRWLETWMMISDSVVDLTV